MLYSDGSNDFGGEHPLDLWAGDELGLFGIKIPLGGVAKSLVGGIPIVGGVASAIIPGGNGGDPLTSGQVRHIERNTSDYLAALRGDRTAQTRLGQRGGVLPKGRNGPWDDARVRDDAARKYRASLQGSRVAIDTFPILKGAPGSPVPYMPPPGVIIEPRSTADKILRAIAEAGGKVRVQPDSVADKVLRAIQDAGAAAGEGFRQTAVPQVPNWILPVAIGGAVILGVTMMGRR